MPREVYKDEGLIEGTHQGADDAAALYDPDVHFEILYAIGRMLKNVTQDTEGLVTAHTLNTATATGVTWNNGDEYILYVGATPDAVLSKTIVCRLSGLSYKRKELVDGEHPSWKDEPRPLKE